VAPAPYTLFPVKHVVHLITVPVMVHAAQLFKIPALADWIAKVMMTAPNMSS
jgi:hypothetical protein